MRSSQRIDDLNHRHDNTEAWWAVESHLTCADSLFFFVHIGRKAARMTKYPPLRESGPTWSDRWLRSLETADVDQTMWYLWFEFSPTISMHARLFKAVVSVEIRVPSRSREEVKLICRAQIAANRDNASARTARVHVAETSLWPPGSAIVFHPWIFLSYALPLRRHSANVARPRIRAGAHACTQNCSGLVRFNQHIQFTLMFWS